MHTFIIDQNLCIRVSVCTFIAAVYLKNKLFMTKMISISYMGLFRKIPTTKGSPLFVQIKKINNK